ncbi:MAG: phosphoribosylformylglycinamidine synthase subunit PurL [Candidatus Eisenbacteria bacterium]
MEALGLTLTPDEARRVAELLGRDPTVVEANIFNTMWSEHCSYKSSREVLKQYLPTEASNVVLGPGEDAGVVRFCEVDGKSYCITLAHESHNHPSQVVPNEGAATGIGGIVRDVYCMGADVIGVLDPLRFGDPNGRNAARTREIVHGVVEGIWQYGNALGVPNLGGDVYFDESFDDNCLVNVVAVGLVEEGDVVRSRAPSEAASVPYDLVLVGKPTDPSGFGGATFASRILDEEKAFDDKYAVQVPDPFLKRMLTVATQEVMKLLKSRGVPIGYKDLGAGGIACVTSELGAAAGLGVRVDLSKVPVAEEGLLPEVIACSETQERYCLVVPRELSADVVRIFNEQFELPELCHGAAAVVVGEVIPEPRFVLLHEGAVVCDASTDQITAGVCYDRARRERVRKTPEVGIPGNIDVADAVLRVLASPNIASREHVYRHYDSEVRGNTVVRPGEADACVVAPIPGSRVGMAIAADGNPFLAALSPYEAGAAAVAEAVRNVAAVGAVPIALTDCLNFGNPEVAEVFQDFVDAVRGIGDAARGIGMKDSDEPIPIISGNVSFYNQSSAGNAVLPSPIVCAVGRVPDIAYHATSGMKSTVSLLLLVGERHGELGASAFMRTIAGGVGAGPPRVRLGEERAMMSAVTDLIQAGRVRSCHDVSDGGMVVALAEMLLGSSPDVAVGAEIELDAVAGEGRGGGVSGARGRFVGDALAACELLFCENGGYLLEIAPEDLERVEGVLEERGAWHAVIGRTTAERGLVAHAGSAGDVRLSENEMSAAWLNGATEVML